MKRKSRARWPGSPRSRWFGGSVVDRAATRLHDALVLGCGDARIDCLLHGDLLGCSDMAATRFYTMNIGKCDHEMRTAGAFKAPAVGSDHGK